MQASPNQNFDHSARRGFTRVEALVVLTIVIVGMVFALVIFMPAASLRRTSPQMQNSSTVRGIHQAMVIYSLNNNTYLPGLDSHGNILPANDPNFSLVPKNTLTGGSMSGRYYILLNEKFISSGDLLINLKDKMAKWKDKTAMPATDQFSYALLRIASAADTTDIGNQAGRIVEWRDNANSQAILISDRNTASTATSAAVRSVWSTTTGTQADWKGTVLWGDNHAEFLNAPNGRLGVFSLNTKYGATINTNDFLFSEQDMPGKVGSASAMFGYTHDNF
jgi:competence protein ComGC